VPNAAPSRAYSTASVTISRVGGVTRTAHGAVDKYGNLSDATPPTSRRFPQRDIAVVRARLA